MNKYEIMRMRLEYFKDKKIVDLKPEEIEEYLALRKYAESIFDNLKDLISDARIEYEKMIYGRL